jgi:hypothetical protein
MKLVGAAFCYLLLAVCAGDPRVAPDVKIIESRDVHQARRTVGRELDGVAPPAFTTPLKSFSVSENVAVGTLVYTATSTGDASRLYTLTGGSRPDVATIFAIHPTTGAVTVWGLVDFESGLWSPFPRCDIQLWYKLHLIA